MLRFPALARFARYRVSILTFCLLEGGLLGLALAMPRFASTWDAPSPVHSEIAATTSATTSVKLLTALNGTVVRLDEGAGQTLNAAPGVDSPEGFHSARLEGPVTQ